MSNLSLTAAIRASAGTASICGRATSWQVYGPYKVTDPSGPSTEITADSYTKARRIGTKWRAEVALCLMGVWSDDVRWAVEEHGDNPYADHSLRGFINAGLAAK